MHNHIPLPTFTTTGAEEIDSICILPTWRPDKVMNIDKDLEKFVVELGESKPTSACPKLIQALKVNKAVLRDHALRPFDMMLP